MDVQTKQFSFDAQFNKNTANSMNNFIFFPFSYFKQVFNWPSLQQDSLMMCYNASLFSYSENRKT